MPALLYGAFIKTMDCMECHTFRIRNDINSNLSNWSLWAAVFLYKIKIIAQSIKVHTIFNYKNTNRDRKVNDIQFNTGIPHSGSVYINSSSYKCFNWNTWKRHLCGFFLYTTPLTTIESMLTIFAVGCCQWCSSRRNPQRCRFHRVTKISIKLPRFLSTFG